MYAGIFILIFGFCVLLVGLYMYSGSGHPIKAITWRVPFKNLTKKEWKNIGKWTIISSIIIMILGIILIIMRLD
jgi:hypothetical protein